MLIEAYTSTAANRREIWVYCPTGRFAIAGGGAKAATSFAYSMEFGTMTGASVNANGGGVDNATLGNPPGAGYTFTSLNDAAGLGNAVHFTTTANVSAAKFHAVCAQ